MPTWKISRTDSAAELRTGDSSSVPAAWSHAAVTVGDVTALIVAARTDAGGLDLLATRAAMEQMILAALG